MLTEMCVCVCDVFGRALLWSVRMAAPIKVYVCVKEREKVSGTQNPPAERAAEYQTLRGSLFVHTYKHSHICTSPITYPEYESSTDSRELETKNEKKKHIVRILPDATGNMGRRRDDAEEERRIRGEERGRRRGKPAVQHSLNYSSTSEWVASDREMQGKTKRQVG